MKLRVSFFVHDLATNPVGRTIALANALKPLYDVEILGLLVSGDQVYPPYRGMFDYKTLRSKDGLANLLKASRALASMSSGHVIYACKPLITSFFPAVLAAGIPKRRPLFLDVDDDNWGHPAMSDLLCDPLCGLRDIDGWLYTRALHPLKYRLDGTTVVSTALQKRYGGILLRHGPDESEFDPARPEFADAGPIRERYRLPRERKLLLFAGTPRAHKGISLLVEVLQRPECGSWDLVLVAPLDHPDVQEARRILGDRCHALGFTPYSEMPALLAAADAVPLPQQPVPFAVAQMPAKLFDAMSMAKPIIASRVGDLGDILGQKERGWVVTPDAPGEFAAALAEVAADPRRAARRGQNARTWFLAEASGSVILERLHTMIQSALRRYPAAHP